MTDEELATYKDSLGDTSNAGRVERGRLSAIAEFAFEKYDRLFRWLADEDESNDRANQDG